MIVSQNICAFVGQNENGILRDLSLSFMREAEPYGVKGHLVDFADADWAEKAAVAVREGLLFAFGFGGVGSGIDLGDKNYWDVVGVPFISMLADPPSWLPDRHNPGLPMVILGYFFDEWLDIQRRFIKAPNLCARLPTCVPRNPHRDDIPWRQRGHRMVFVKTGESPAKRRASWQQFPKRLREIMEDAANEACSRETQGLTDLLLEVVDGHDLSLDGRTDILFRLMYELDDYVRMERATRVVEALSHFPVEIIGRGWDHINKQGAKATFLPAVPASSLARLTADTQFMVNTTQNIGSSVHERVPLAFAAKTCSVSDRNAYSRTYFQEIPTFFGIDWHSPDLKDQVAAIWNSTEDYGECMEPAFQTAETVFAPLNLMFAAFELAEVFRFGAQLKA